MSDLLYTKDLYVNAIDSYQDVEIKRGEVYRYNSGYISLTSGQYYILSSICATGGTSIYTLANIAKTGYEVGVELIEDGTYTQGTASLIAGYNLNRNYPDAPNTTYPIYGGISTATTLVGGTTISYTLLPGTSGGNTRPGGAGSNEVIFYLQPGKRYTLKLTAIGGAVTLATTIDLIFDEEKRS